MPTDRRPPVLVTWAVLVLLASGCAGQEPAAGPEPGAQVGAGGTQEPSAAPAPSAAPTPIGDRDRAGAATATPEPGAPEQPVPQGTSESDESVPGVEVPPAAEGGEAAPAPGTTPLPGLGEDRDPGPLVTAPLPRSAAARDRLVTGFPAFLRPAPGSTVETSSVAAADPRLQVALVGSTARSADAVLRSYRTRLTSRGMRETGSTPAAAGARAAAFVLGQSAVTVTVQREGGLTSYSVHGVLHTGDE